MNKTELAKLKEVRQLLEMETCSFHAPDERGFNPAQNDAFTAQVREQTRIWRESWILPVLDELIAKYEAKHSPDAALLRTINQLTADDLRQMEA